MQLVAYGAQDIYLTGNPQITFFKVVYRRHTNFSMETISQTLDGNATIGTSQNESSCTISRNGDLIYKMYVVIPSAKSVGLQYGSEVVQSVELEIGGQLIDKHTKEWNNVWNELTLTNNKGLALKDMLSENYTIRDGKEHLIQLPLNFYFCKNPGLALPLIALQYHEVKINFVFGSTDDTHATSGTSIKFYVDYIYLDTDERRRFAQVSHEYLIEQVQMQSIVSDISQDLNFNHPVKELIWLTDKHYDYNTALLKLNGHDRFEKQEEEYFQLRQPFDYHTHIPRQNLSLESRINHNPIPSLKHLLKKRAEDGLEFGIFTGEVAAEPEPSSSKYYVTKFAEDDALPVGSFDFAPLPIVNNLSTDMGTLSAGEVSYVFNTDDVHDFKVNHEYKIVFGGNFHRQEKKKVNPNNLEGYGFLYRSLITQTVKCIGHSASSAGADDKYRFVKFNRRFENIHKLNVQLDGISLDRLSSDLANDYFAPDLPTDPSDLEIIFYLVGQGRWGFLKITDIIELSEGGNLSSSGSSKLDKKINVYSFALRPEEHQPSGSCNFSRIDTATLEFGKSPTGSNGNIYAVNYNVLRIMSGMGGLAYSN